nr:hypothetical protein [Pseudomonadota bacterium]
EWNGRIQLNSFPTDFVLNVGFDGTDGTLDGFAVNYSRSLVDLSGDGDLLVDGTFDENGLISGTVTLDWFTGNVKTGVKLNDGLHEANLTGIIGQEGAVGVFIREGLFAGGFIAGPNIVLNPNVTYSDWTRSFTTTPLNYDPTAENQFLHTTGNVIDVGAAVSQSDVDFFTTAPIKQSLDFSAFTSGGESLGLSADDGLAYFQGEVGGSTYAYAGIFQTTDLGAPITDSSFSATWAGKLQIDTFSMVDFDLTVAFDGADGTLTGVRQNFTGLRDFIIDGKFDAKGVITGKVHNQLVLQEITLAHSLRNGTLSGLIGQEGAVGVFHGTSGGSGYSGGFVASPAVAICVKDVFDADCPVNTDVFVQKAFCLNTVANEGKNPFHAMCNTDGTTHGDVNGARDTTCLARGAMADTRCANRANVLTACDMDAYRQTTGLGGSNTNLCTGTSTTYTDTYSNLRLECEKSDVGSFESYCDSQDLMGAVQTARNDYCGAKLTDLSEATNNCMSRYAATCTTTPTAPFAGICGIAVTPQQLTACSGTVANLMAKGALASDCNDDDLSGAICGDTNSMGGSNPFADICSNMDAIIAGFDKGMAQDTYCRASIIAAEGLSSGVCFTIKGTFCDGADATDNPYAPLCGANPLAKESFCEMHGTTGLDNPTLCVNSRASVCPTAPFTDDTDTNCFASGAISYANHRSEQCSDGTETDSVLCNTSLIVTAVCATTGDYANPFAAFCATGTGASSFVNVPDLIQMALDMCDAGNDNAGLCANTTMARNDLRTVDCIVTNPDVLFAAGCDYTEFRSVEINYCDETGTAWEARCNDVMAEAAVKMARDTACTTYGTTAGGDNSCPNRENVREDCNDDPFTKIGNDNSVDLCTGMTADSGGELYSDRRTSICETLATTFDIRCGTDNKYGSNTNSQRNAVCHANPFDTNCVNTYLVRDTDKLAFCRDAIRNPEGKDNTFCGTGTPLISGACSNNPGDPVCDDDFSDKVTAGDWTRAQPALLRTDPGPKNQFLAIEETTISTEGTSAAPALGGGDPTVYKLDFSEFTYGGQSLGLSAADGLAYFGGQFAGSRRDYAGIYGTTDLGAPIADDGFSATWAGKFQFGSDSKDFDLKVTFSSTTGTLDGFIKNFTGGFDFLIDGEFDAKGVITGGVHLANFMNDVQTDIADGDHNGILSGIIGSDGAVGVFHGTSGYSGGFVAIPTTTGLIATACGTDSGDPICPDDDVTKVTASDWERVRESALNTDPTTAGSQFLKIAEKTIGDTAEGFTKNSATRTLDFSAFTYGGASLGLSDNDGLAYFNGRIVDSFYHYAGIYDTTDLGAPITDSTLNATWAGKIRFGGADSKDFDLKVTFDGTTGTGTVNGFIVDILTTFDFLIDGEFDANGVITGGVHWAVFESETSPETPAPFDGVLSGIIGQDGAVGVFYGQHSGNDANYSGGFVAVPTTIGPITTRCAGDSGDPICPDDDVTKVTAKDWQRGRDSALNTIPTNKDQFLKIADKTISDTAVGFAKSGPTRTLDFSEFTYGGAS